MQSRQRRTARRNCFTCIPSKRVVYKPLPKQTDKGPQNAGRVWERGRGAWSWVFPHAAQTLSHTLSLSVRIFENANVSTTCSRFLMALRWPPVISVCVLFFLRLVFSFSAHETAKGNISCSTSEGRDVSLHSVYTSGVYLHSQHLLSVTVNKTLADYEK